MQPPSDLLAHRFMFTPAPQNSLPAAGVLVSAADRQVFVNPSQFYLGPPPSAGLANLLLELDHDRFKKLFVDLMTKPIRKA